MDPVGRVRFKFSESKSNPINEMVPIFEPDPTYKSFKVDRIGSKWVKSSDPFVALEVGIV